MPTKCYDFPEVVIHDSSGKCGRYQEGGTCHPLPTPVPPYTEDEEDAMKGYEAFIANELEDPRLIKAKGDTHFPGPTINGIPFEIVPADSPLGRAILASMEVEGKPN
jgi:hypothetical protein